MPVDPADYPTTSRGYRYPTQINAGGSEANAETDPPADLKRLADAVDADVAAVEAAAGAASSGVASDLADHEAATTAVHGIADTSSLVTSARQVIAGTGLTGGGTLAADRTLAVAYGSSAGTAAQGNDSRLSDTRTPTDGSVTTAKIAAGGLAKTAVTGTAVTAADTGTVTDTMLAGSITPSKVSGTAVVQARTITAGTGLTGGGTLAADRTLAVDYTVTAPLGITVGTTAVTLSSAQPVYVHTGGAITLTLPAAASNTGVVFSVFTQGTGTVTLSRGAGTVNGVNLSPTIPGVGNLRVVSDGTTWRVIDGGHATFPDSVATLGKATYQWDHSASGTTASAWWRLVGYNSGVRSMAASATTPVDCTLNALTVQRRLDTVRWVVDITSATAPVGDTGGDLVTLGGVWAPSISVYTVGGSASTVLVGLLVSTAGLVRVAWSDSGLGRRYAALSYGVTSTLPTSLPGTQITAPV